MKLFTFTFFVLFLFGCKPINNSSQVSESSAESGDIHIKILNAEKTESEYWPYNFKMLVSVPSAYTKLIYTKRPNAHTEVGVFINDKINLDENNNRNFFEINLVESAGDVTPYEKVYFVIKAENEKNSESSISRKFKVIEIKNEESK